MRLFTLFTLVLVLILCSQCALDSAEEKEPTLNEVLPGTWLLVSASRNGKPTSTLEGVYFNFDTLGMVKTNLSGIELNANCNIEENTFSYKEGQETRQYNAEIIHQDTINISTKIRIFDFALLLSRASE